MLPQNTPSWVPRRLVASALFILALILVSCDSSDETPVTPVDSLDRMSDSELIQNQASQREPDVYYFGFDLRSSPQEDAAQYMPFLRYLEAATGLKFKLHFTSKSSTTVDDLGLDRTQFAAMGAEGFLRASSKYGALSLVRGLNREDKAEYQSVFVTKPGSPISNIIDIKGRKLALGDRHSTQGHLIPRIVLLKNAISLDDLESYEFTGSHQNCAEAVVSGRFDVGAMQDSLAERLESEGHLKIIHRSDRYPSSGIVANTTVPAEVISLVTQALLDFDPQDSRSQTLHNWDETEMPNGFVQAKQSDYQELRKWSLQIQDQTP